MPTTVAQAESPLIVLVERACLGGHDPALHEIARAAGGGPVHLIAPASAVAGEEWLIDRSARERDAYARLASWTLALAPHASAVAAEIGDESPRLAVADARRHVGRDARLVAVSEPNASRPPARLSAARPVLRRVTRALV